MGGAFGIWLLAVGGSRQESTTVAEYESFWRQDASNVEVMLAKKRPRGKAARAWVGADDPWFAATDAVSRAWALDLSHRAIARKAHAAGGLVLGGAVVALVALVLVVTLLLGLLDNDGEPVPSSVLSLLGIILALGGLMFSVGAKLVRDAAALAGRQKSRLEQWRRDGTTR